MPGIAGRPVIFGEVLFDQFEDGTSVLGGAPFNVAWHLQGFGLNPMFISRVGQDAGGEAVLATMMEWGLDSHGVEIDPGHPTGTVQVKLDAGQPTFDIVPEQAYDYISATLVMDALQDCECSLIYYGTLATRSRVSAEGLRRLRDKTSLPAFVDINLRPPWWQPQGVIETLRGANWLKLNQHELIQLLGREHLAPPEYGDAARELLDRYGLKMIILTLGADGACIVSADGVECAQPVQVESLVDTVGAGDAFSAATIYGLLQGWPRELILSRASGFSAAICKQRGATQHDPALYARHREQWQE